MYRMQKNVLFYATQKVMITLEVLKQQEYVLLPVQTQLHADFTLFTPNIHETANIYRTNDFQECNIIPSR